MEDLTKQQLILLALLVSFVTSIATGIATVSLLDQAPPQVTRVINRVVERTVETVVPSSQTAAVSTNTVSKEETVVVRDDELITESIATASQSIVRVADRNGTVQAFGFVLSKDGMLLASTENIPEYSVYSVILPGGVAARARVVNRYPDQNIATLSLESIPEGVTLAPLAIASEQNIQLGNSVIVISGTEKNQVSLGIISRIDQALPTDGNETPEVTGVYTNITDPILSGTPLLNLFGEVIGVRTHGGSAVFTPVSMLAPALTQQVSE
jgi:S1-C subfamily serine protease